MFGSSRISNWLRRTLPLAVMTAAVIVPAMAFGQDAATAAPAATPPPTVEDAMTKIAEGSVIANTVWTLIAGMLVFWMNAGFASLEAGLCRRKNAVHILAKNFIVFAVSSIAFWAIGFGMMFGASRIGGAEGAKGFIGWAPMFPSLLGDAGNYPALSWTNVPESVKFFFQLVFAGTAATIVSGAVAERTKFNAFMLFSFILVALIYPITGHWIWGNGWLANLSVAPFHDFAGSTTVHSVGGWAALAGVIMVGPRLGKQQRLVPGNVLKLAQVGA